MIIYRPHHGGLAESLAEAKIFDSVDEMKTHICEHWKSFSVKPPFGVNDIVIDFDSPGQDDPRCGWHDTRYVCVKRMYDKVYEYPQCIGMCATDFDAK